MMFLISVAIGAAIILVGVIAASWLEERRYRKAQTKIRDKIDSAQWAAVLYEVQRELDRPKRPSTSPPRFN